MLAYLNDASNLQNAYRLELYLSIADSLSKMPLRYCEYH